MASSLVMRAAGSMATATEDGVKRWPCGPCQSQVSGSGEPARKHTGIITAPATGSPSASSGRKRQCLAAARAASASARFGEEPGWVATPRTRPWVSSLSLSTTRPPSPRRSASAG